MAAAVTARAAITDMGETFGVGVFITGMAVFLGGAYAAATGQIDDVFIWAFGIELLKTILLWGVIVLVLILAFVVWARSDSDTAHGHVTYAAGTDKGLASLEKHEKAHQKVTAAVGGGGSTIYIWATKGGGWAGKCVFHNPSKVAALEPEKKIAIAVAGVMAAPDTTSPTDKPHAKAYAREADDPAQAMRKGRQIARRII